MRARKSALDMPIASAPALSTKRFCTSGWSSVRRTSLFILSTTACGVPFGAKRPTQIDASRSAIPPSRGVGQSGLSGDFFAVVMPITLPFPDLRNGAAPGTAITPKSTSPAPTAAAAGAPPL